MRHCSLGKSNFEALSRAVAVAAALITWSSKTSSVHAAESQTQYLPGVTIGAPIGTLPPPGLYFSLPINYYGFDLKNDMGRDAGLHLNVSVVNPNLLYVPDIPKVFGATYGAFLAQPIAFAEISGLASGRQIALVNTYVAPVNLSWSLTPNLFFNLQYGFYIPDGTDYNAYKSLNMARNYFTSEFGAGLSYLDRNWNLTLHPLVDVNTTNRDTSYHSGATFAMDYTALYTFDKLSLGIGGTYVNQFEKDTVGGVAVPAIPGIRGLGNRNQFLTVGPIIKYDFGDFSARIVYTKNVYARNVAAGDTVFLTIDLPIFSSAPRASMSTGPIGSRN